MSECNPCDNFTKILVANIRCSQTQGTFRVSFEVVNSNTNGELHDGKLLSETRTERVTIRRPDTIVAEKSYREQ